MPLNILVIGKVDRKCKFIVLASTANCCIRPILSVLLLCYRGPRELSALDLLVGGGGGLVVASAGSDR